jgi:hypothetical protein
LLIVFAFGLLTAAYERINTPALMSDAARAYLNSLTPELRAKTTIAFTDDEDRTGTSFLSKIARV